MASLAEHTPTSFRNAWLYLLVQSLIRTIIPISHTSNDIYLFALDWAIYTMEMCTRAVWPKHRESRVKAHQSAANAASTSSTHAFYDYDYFDTGGGGGGWAQLGQIVMDACILCDNLHSIMEIMPGRAFNVAHIVCIIFYVAVSCGPGAYIFGK